MWRFFVLTGLTDNMLEVWLCLTYCMLYPLANLYKSWNVWNSSDCLVMEVQKRNTIHANFPSVIKCIKMTRIPTLQLAITANSVIQITSMRPQKWPISITQSGPCRAEHAFSMWPYSYYGYDSYRMFWSIWKKILLVSHSLSTKKVHCTRQYTCKTVNAL